MAYFCRINFYDMPTFREDLHLGHKVALWETDDIRDKAVTTEKIDDGAVTTAKIGDGEVHSEDIADNAVITQKIGDGEVKTRNIGTGAVTTDKILDDAVVTDKLADGSVTTKKIADGNILTDKIADLAVTTRKIADNSVITEKLGEEAVTTPKIADNSVLTGKIADGNVTTEKFADLSITTPKIANRAVTREKLADEAVPELLGVMDEFIAATRNEISNFKPLTIRGNVVNAPDEEDLTASQGLMKLKDRSGFYGYAMKILRRDKTFAEQISEMRCIYVVKYDFNLGGETIEMPADSIILFDGGRLTNGTLNGSVHNGIADSNSAGMYGLLLCSALYYEYMEGVTLTGEYMDETAHSFQDQINAIVMDKATVNLTATPSPVFVGSEVTISLNATTNTSASSIKIKKGSTVLATGSGSSLSGSDTITPSAAGNTTYSAEFIIAGLSKATTRNVVAVYPIRIGSGTSYLDGTPISTPKTSPAGTYNVVVAADGDYVYFNVPATMSISHATMSGFDFPLEAPETVEINGVSYKSYRSSNTYDAGTLTIVIS